MMRPLILVPCLLASAHFAAAVASSQPVVIRGDPTCRTCNIERQVIVRIGEAGDELINGPVNSPVVRDGRGRFFVNDQDDGPVKVFTSNGKFATLLGRKGDGPGESMWAATTAVGVGDSVFVTDRTLMTCNVFGPDLKFVRSFPVALSAIAVHSQVVDGLLVVNAWHWMPPIGFPLVAFDATGRLAKQIGPQELHLDESQTERIERVIGRTESGKGGLLVAHRHRYQWWKLSSKLDPEAEFVREASWFRRYDPPNTQPLQMDGVSYLKAIWEDDAGRTWVGFGTIHVRVTDGGKTERTESSRVEVLDVSSRTVLASVEFPERLVSGFSDGTVVTSEVRDNGRTVLSVIRLSLRP
jgi:hypothetical protein